jgi:hypothetical protein
MHNHPQAKPRRREEGFGTTLLKSKQMVNNSNNICSRDV